MPHDHAPDIVAPQLAAPRLRERGYAALSATGLTELAGVQESALAALAPSWGALPADAYLRDGGHYRRRRHSCFMVAGGELTSVPHRAHWQPVEYNALHGGLERWFEPIDANVVTATAWSALLTGIGQIATATTTTEKSDAWYVEAHQFRIDTSDGIGRPTPEGAHRDGVNFVAVILIGRAGVKGGETRVFDADSAQGVRFTMTAPWTTLLLDDARVVHETTPIQPLVAKEPLAQAGHRDTLVLTYRRGGFQGPTK